jgi:protein TonB
LNSFTVWVHKNVTYPSIARDNGVQGRIIIQFTVGPDGVVRDIKAIRSVDVTLEKEAIRVVKSSPKWEPGVKDGASVATRMNIPVIFRLL